MAKVRVPVFRTTGKSVLIDPDTRAVFGENVYDADGQLVELDSLGGSSAPAGGPDTTDDLPEGIYRKYFTDKRAQDAVGAILVDNDAIRLVYANGTLSAMLRDAGVTPGTYGDAAHAAKVTVDAQGRITQAEAVATGYVHDQPQPATTWTIAHNLGKYPAVTVVDSADSVVIGAVSYIDQNTIKIEFAAAMAGQAFLN